MGLRQYAYGVEYTRYRFLSADGCSTWELHRIYSTMNEMDSMD
jgi:hypothetical protein